MQKAYNLFHRLFTATSKMAQIRIGYLLQEILDRFQKKLERKLKQDRILWVYSTTELVINSLLNGLGMLSDVNTYIRPGNALAIDLYLLDSVPMIQIRLIDLHKTIQSRILRIKGCEDFCALDFVQLTFRSMMPRENPFETLCALNSTE